MNALVVDDSRAIRMMLSMTLKDIGFNVREAEHGRHALKVIEEHGVPDLICIDWNMPEMTGIELVKELRRRSDCAGIHLIMITSEAEMDRMAAALEAGADEYLMKPFRKEDLVEKLRMIGAMSS